ncbi:YqcC family protein [Shewanella sp. UCD-KL12]|uniref:YqcC family protein n=1 Tax=Shewanella sp. UCD-KL12 TaxID=1917163 RepID=UPI0009707C73|nr:YqcC family protein [Shewanella sp. UCD-KL12]
MVQDSRYEATSHMLYKIENELKNHALWSDQAPSIEAMADTSPFSVETMPFENWVQFIFLPKMRSLINAKRELPSSIAIAPMASHLWNHKAELQTLITVFEELDKFLSESR